MKYWTTFLFEEGAATAVEYAVMLAMIILSVYAAIAGFGLQTGGLWGSIGTNLTAHGF